MPKKKEEEVEEKLELTHSEKKILLHIETKIVECLNIIFALVMGALVAGFIGWAVFSPSWSEQRDIKFCETHSCR